MTAFEQYRTKAFPHRYHGQIVVDAIAGGVPSDPKVTEGWLRSKLADKDDLIRELVATTVVERGVSVEEAVEIADSLKNLCGFKRDESGLYVEGRQLKAALKEAAMVCVNAGKLPAEGWGDCTNRNYRKHLRAWLAEHVFVVEDRLHLGVTVPTRTETRFVHARYSAIKSFEVVEHAKIDFTVITDHDFPEDQWAAVWLAAEQLGLGADRSQGMGRFTVTRWAPADNDTEA